MKNLRTTLEPNTIRKKTIKFSCDTNAGHLASSLSTVELLAVLFRDFMNFNENNPKDTNRDILIFSKGHGCYAYYMILNELGFIPDDEINSFGNDYSLLKGCIVKNETFMLEASTGSLGHGLPIAVGIAKAFKMQKLNNKVICIVGDGEMQEGSNFEALNLAYKFKLDNLLVVVDANKLQAMDFVENVSLSNDKLACILKNYTDNFFNINGHNEKDIFKAYDSFFNKKNNQITIVVANTVKGEGLEMIENKPMYHYRCPTEDGYKYDI